MLLPAVLQQPGSFAPSDLCQAALYSSLPCWVEDDCAQVQGRCLEGCLEDIRNVHEENVPHEQAKQGGPNAPLSMGPCNHNRDTQQSVLTK